jgi:hypothetical protein
MIRRLLVLLLFSIIVVGGSAFIRTTQSASPEPCSQDHDAWLKQVLEKMETVRPGMTRADLLKVFRTEGGISTGLRRTFVGRDCPYIKVDVEFEAVAHPELEAGPVFQPRWPEDSRDVIVKISKPYVQFAIGD